MFQFDGACKSIDWSLIDDKAVFSAAVSKTLSVHGSYTLSALLKNGFKGKTIFASAQSGNTITTAATIIVGDWIFDGSGSWELSDAVTTGNDISIHLKKGSLFTNNKAVACGYFIGNSTFPRALSLGSSTISIDKTWDFSSPANLNFNAGTSNILLKDIIDQSTFRSGNLTYNDVQLMTTFCNPSGTPCTANLNITMSAVNITCNGLCNGSASVVSVTGGSGTFAFDWQGALTPSGDFTDSIFNLCAGNYTVRVTDLGSGLFCFCNINVTEPSVLFDYELFSVQPSCNGVCDGVVAVDATGGTPPYTYLWSPGGFTNDTVSGLCDNAYDIQVTDSNGCIGSTTVVITEPPLLVAPGTFTNVTCFGFCNGTASVNASGGSPPYTYNWTPLNPVGDGTPNITNLCPGSYTVTVTDTNFCTATYVAAITEPPVLGLTVTQTNATCGGVCDGTATATVTGGTVPFTYSWSNGSVTTTSSTTNTISGLCAGSYTLQVTDGNSCVISDTVIITQPDTLVATATGTNVTCFNACNGSASATVTGGTAGYTYNWTGTPIGDLTPNISSLCPGTYVVTVLDVNGCTDTGSVTITEPPLLVANFTNTNVLCFGLCNGTATAMPTGGTPGYTYNWIPGNPTGEGSPNVSALCPGTYNVIITDANNCVDTSSAIVVTQPTQLLTGASFTNVTCNGSCNGTATANPSGGTAGYTYLWSTGAVTPGVTGLCPGSYTVTVTDANGCTASTTISITQPNSLSVTIASTNLACNGVCNATAAATVSGGTAGYTFDWSGSPVGDGTPNINSLCAGTYSVMVVDANGCPATASTTVTQPTALTLVTAISNASCFAVCDGSAAAIAGGGTPPYSYLWSPAALTTPVINGQCAGTYTVTLTDFNGCTRMDTVTITQPNQLFANPTVLSPITCAGLCNGSATSSPSGGSAPYSYNWTPLNPMGDGTPTITNLCAGTYSLTVTDSNSCTSTQSIVLTQPLILSAPISGSTSSCNICNGTATVSPAGGTPPYTYLWNDGQTTPTATGLCPNITYTVTVTDFNGCVAVNTVTISQTIIITITTSNTTLSCFGACDGIATANAAGGSVPYAFLWVGSAGIVSTNQTATGLCAGTYTVTVSDANGCFNTDTVTFTNPPALVISATSTNVTCGGACDGTASASAVGGSGAYSFDWSPGGQTTAAVNSLCIGTYTVIVTDGNGCMDTAQVIITEPTPVVDNVTITDANCTFADGTISVAPTGGSGPGTYTYDWSPGSPLGEGTPTITNLLPGVYSLIISSGGCSFNFSYLLNNTNGPSLITSQTEISCNSVCDGTATTVASGGLPGYTYDWMPGAPAGDLSPTITSLCGTITYTVQVTDAAGCITFDTTTLFNPTVISPNAVIVNESCGGTCDGSITLAPSGGNPPYTFSWSTGSTNASITGLCAGPYTYTVTDANGCDTSAVINITSPPALSVSLTSTNVLCASACNGTAQATVAGGTGPFTFTWSHGAFILPTVVNLCPGGYTVTVTDANNCTATDTVIISEPTPLTSFTSQVNVSCFGLCNGIGMVTSMGGTPPYSYLWNPGSIANDTATGLCAGFYNATVTDANGCVSSPPAITITQPAPILPNVVTTNPLCAGSCNGAASSSPSGGTAPFTYVWNPGGFTTSTVNTLCAGTYTVTVTDTLGCSGNEIFTLTAPPALIANASATSPTCVGSCDGSVTSNAIGGTGAYSYFWMPGAAVTQSVSSLCTGNYTVFVSDANNCSDTQTVAVTNPLPINIVVGSTPANCGVCDGTINITPITGLPPYTYAWTPALPAVPNQTNLCAGLYSVIVTDANGCDSTFIIPLNNSSGPTGEVVSTVSATCNGVCNGSGSIDAVIGGVAPFTFLWNDPAATANDTATNLCAGNYFVEVTDASGCIHFSPVVIDEPDPIVSNEVITSAVCSNICTGAITVSPTGGTGAYTYNWAPAPIAGQGTPTVTGLCSGGYTLTITDANMCVDVDSFVVSQSTPLTASISSNSISCSSACSGVAFVTISSGTAPFSIQWNDPSGQTNDTATALCAGNYSVTITDANGCVLTLNTTITATPAVAANAVVTNAACGLCDGQVVLNPSGGTSGYTYLWSNGQTSATATGLCAGLYTVDITDSAGCVTSVPMPVSNTTGPSSAVITSTNISCSGSCNGAVTAVTPAGGTAPYSFLWIHSGQTTAAISGLCAGTYFVQITDANGCSLTDSVTITEPAAIAANQVITAASCGLCDGEVTIAPSGGLPPYSILWNTGSTLSTLTNLCAGVYSVTITDAAGCVQTIFIPISSQSAPALTMSSSNISCNGLCDGTATVSATGGISPYSYLWNDLAAQTTPVAGNLCPGTYFVEVTDANGCIAVASTTVTQPSPIGFSLAGIQNPLCNGNSNGSITVIPSGGTLAYSYVWSPAPAAGQTTATVTGLNANTYNVIVTDANGCTASQSMILTNPTSLVISSTATSSSCNTTADGAIDVTVSGGTLPYSYQWSGCSTATTEDLSSILSCSSYIITVTDSNSCVIADSIDLLANQTVTAIAGNDTTFCESGSLTLNASGSVGGVNFQWFILPANTSIGAASSVIVSPSNGVTTYYVSVNNGTGCSDNDTIVVTSNPLPGADAGPDQTIVIGAGITIGGNPTTSATGAGILWNPSPSLDNSNSSNPLATPSTTTTYTVTVTTAQGCVSSDSVLVTVLPTIIIPDGISPNADGANDEWIIDGIELFPNCNVEVYNRWGELLFQSPGYKEKWDGTFQGKLLPVGTYYYIIDLGDPLFPDAYTGPITLMR
jgi:gliding motility-associated-like protein